MSILNDDPIANLVSSNTDTSNTRDVFEQINLSWVLPTLPAGKY